MGFKFTSRPEPPPSPARLGLQQCPDELAGWGEGTGFPSLVFFLALPCTYVQAVTLGKVRPLFHPKSGQCRIVVRLKWPRCEKVPVSGLTHSGHSARESILSSRLQEEYFYAPWNARHSQCVHIFSHQIHSKALGRRDLGFVHPPGLPPNRRLVNETE